VDDPIDPLVKAYIDEKIREAIDPKNETRKKKWKNSWRSASPITKGTFTLTASVAAATIAYAVIAGFQLIAMHRTNNLTQSALGKADQNSLESSKQFQVQLQHFDAGLGETSVLAGNAEKQAKAAKDANAIALNVAHSQTRPWLTISTLKITKETVDANATNFQKTWNFDISLANYGNSPARRIVITMEPIQETTQYIAKVGDKSWKDTRGCAEIENSSMKDYAQSTLIVFPQQIGVPAEPQGVHIDNTINRVERTPMIVACIAYQGAGTDIHHTKLLYKPVRSPESVPVTNFPKRRYFQVIRYEISDTDAN
jgi:hypothetical protein